VPNNQCLPRQGRIAADVCLSGKVLLGFAWVITLILLGYVVTLSAYGILHHTTDSNVWNETVREYPWFSASSTLSSSPPSPTVEKGPDVLSLKHPRPKVAFNPAGLTRKLSPFEDPVQPVPTFDSIPQPSYQPLERRYQGVHFATIHDPVPIVEPVFTRPREAPRPPVSVQSLYPEHLQGHLSMEARNNLYNQSRRLEGQEPPPIGDWPRIPRTKRLPPPPRPTEADALTQQPFSSISPDQRMWLSGTTNGPSPGSYGLRSPIWESQNASIRRQPPPPLNLDGISNKYGARR